jgi:DNA gyrase subunit A
MSVIVARALPDVRDGLKPVHRRILYAMHDLGLDPDKPYKKSARIVGEVLGKYHPHGDVAVYEAMVRMAQDFSLRYPLVDGQGNFGSVDGDNAAAMRYTEARLARIAVEMLADIEKDTVDWTENFDGTLKEPSVLPAALPNLVVNGASGIAVGMSTSIPPHNLGEVCDALCYLIDHSHRAEDVSVEDLMRFIPGPDFPTGGLVYRFQHENGADGEEDVDVIARAYAVGKGRIIVQAKAHIEEMSRSRSRIVVTELPYQTNKTNLMERIAELVRDGRLEGITDLRDESDRTGMRVCIETTRTVEPREVLAELYRLTPLQGTFSISLLALVHGEPTLLSLKRMLQHFLEHRQDVIRRRSEYDLARAKLRAHILEGLLRALDVLDEIIALIRRSRTADIARQGLIREFQFSEVQAQAILDMQLRRLAALERQRLADEYKEVLALIKELEELLASPEKVLALIRKNLVTLKATYGDTRRTQIADRVKGALTTLDVLPDQEVWVTLAADGTLTRRSREPMRSSDLKRLAADAGPVLLTANTRDDLYLFSAKGQATRLGVHQIPEASGAHFADVSGLIRRDRVVGALALPKPQTDGTSAGYLLLGTVLGKVKRINLTDLSEQAHTNPPVINLDDGDELLWVSPSAGGGEVLLATAGGQAIRFAEDEVRATGLPAGGMGGVKLQSKDRVVAGIVAPASASPDIGLAVLTARGWGRVTPLAEFPTQGRNGQGVLAARPTERTGPVAALALLRPGEYTVILMSGGANRLIPGTDWPALGRSAQGKALFEPGRSEQVRGVLAIAGPTAGSAPAMPVKAPSPAGKDMKAASPKAPPARATTTKTDQLTPVAAKARGARTAAPAQPSLLPELAEEAKPARARSKAGTPTPTAVASAQTPVPAAPPKPDRPSRAQPAVALKAAPPPETTATPPPATRKTAARATKTAAVAVAATAVATGLSPAPTPRRKRSGVSGPQAAEVPAASPPPVAAGKTSPKPKPAPTAAPTKTGKTVTPDAVAAPPPKGAGAKMPPKAASADGGARVFQRSDLGRLVSPARDEEATQTPAPGKASTKSPEPSAPPKKPKTPPATVSTRTPAPAVKPPPTALKSSPPKKNPTNS